MKLLRYGAPGHERPGRLDASGGIRDLSALVHDLGREALSDTALERLRAIPDNDLPLAAPARVGPCVAQVGKIVCIGLNYADHAAETGKPVPAEPIIFLKATSALCGPNDDVQRPRGAQKLDYEVELGVVIGSTARYVSADEALAHVAGYCVVNDVSERAFQSERGGQWTKGKSHDSFCPIGPWLVTRDEVPDPQKLGLWLDVDGVQRQRGSTATMVFGVAELVSYVSQFMTLNPGDVLATGTPPGVGLGMKPPTFLQPGQLVTLGIDGLGSQSQRIVEG